MGRLLTKMRIKLKKIKHLELFDGVDSKTLDFFEAMETNEPSDNLRNWFEGLEHRTQLSLVAEYAHVKAAESSLEMAQQSQVWAAFEVEEAQCQYEDCVERFNGYIAEHS